MHLLEILEAGMLFCFGFAWPFNIYKSFKARSNTGKSFFFLLVIWMGYLLGILLKAFSVPRDYVLWLYVINCFMVSIDIALFFRNTVISKRNKETALPE